ncbi:MULTISPECIES: ABC transporter ATP-binding protein [unclassified Corynebacterium]|uniref:ABC transporter ATP-binding protein n=1 Tax=unclassified Corynebacterium TaxID=2624378 RepID=UPI0029C9B435|nr:MULTISPECIES: ABC transporter ATP-binding protein [unclassified Corynebacterium]WPF66029.1 ABC transporter ATP-binding protein [Corynebacterium sp. 22KM0430]WPF68522.1 ABC transporter ATP-binding protein [Corynebacterium sp. 21KM1197]
MDVLKISGLRADVPGRTLFTGLDVEVRAGEALAVVGPSGVGKSTLLNQVLGLAPAPVGEIEVAGRRMNGVSRAQAAAVRRENIGVIFQDGELIPELSARDNVAVAQMMMDRSGGGEERAGNLLDMLGVSPNTLARDLSGGERQRAAIARALVTDPAMILADEPTGALDTLTRDEVADQLFSLVHEQGKAMLVVTHDETIARRADRVVNLADYALGRLR